MGRGGDGGSPSGDGSVLGPADASPIDCTDVVCHYVRSGAAGGGDGSGWSGAWTELPDQLERGHVYYVAAGDYPGYRFDDAAAGDEVITIVRATAGDHGDGDGWEEGFDGPAVFGPIEIVRPGYRLDGRGRGIRVRGAFEGTALVVSAGPQELRWLDIVRLVYPGGRETRAEGRLHVLQLADFVEPRCCDVRRERARGRAHRAHHGVV